MSLTLPRGYLVCGFMFLAYFMVYFHRVCPAVIALDMQRAFGVGGAMLGLLSSAYFYSYALMQLPTGLLADSWGPRKTVSASLLLAALGSAIMGLAPDTFSAMAGRVMVGLGVATVFVCNFKLLAEWFTPRRFVIMGGVFQAVGGLGALCASAPLAWISNQVGWRGSLLGAGFFTLLLAAGVLLMVRDRPQDPGLPPVALQPASEQELPHSLLAGIWLVLSARRFWPFAIWNFMQSGVSFAIEGLWGGPYLQQVYGLSKTQAGAILSTFALALILGGPVLCALANRLGRKPVLMGLSVLSALTCLVLLVFIDTLPKILLMAVFFCASLSGAAAGPITAAVGKELFPLSMAGTAMGTGNLFPFMGAAFFQVAMGAALGLGAQAGGINLTAGYRYMFLLCLLGSLVSAAAAVFLRETLPGKAPEPAAK